MVNLRLSERQRRTRQTQICQVVYVVSFAGFTYCVFNFRFYYRYRSKKFVSIIVYIRMTDAKRMDFVGERGRKISS